MTDSLRAGELTRYVDIQQRSTSQDSFGGVVNTWTTIKSVYAAISPASATEVFKAGAMVTDVTDVITVRYDATLWADPRAAAAYRVQYGSRVYEILGVLNMDESNRTVTLATKEGLTLG